MVGSIGPAVGKPDGGNRFRSGEDDTGRRAAPMTADGILEDGPMKQESIVQHISRQYMQELEDIRARVLAMGGMVEQQLADAFTALAHQDAKLGKQVIANDHQVDAMEV